MNEITKTKMQVERENVNKMKALVLVLIQKATILLMIPSSRRIQKCLIHPKFFKAKKVKKISKYREKFANNGITKKAGQEITK